MDLDERKRHILKALINDYIVSAEPVGSRTIAKRYRLGISSATIRNEMADLEDMGYLEQPHTSAGRVPSDKGYRIYVDQLMGVEKLSQEEAQYIRTSIQKIAMGEIERIIRETSKILSFLTNYTAMVMAPETRKSTLKRIQLVSIDTTHIVAIAITNFGVVKSTNISLSKAIDIDKLVAINNLLNDKLTGLTIEEINLEVITKIQREVRGYNEILNEILPILYDSLKCMDDREVYLEGSSNIFNYPEYNAIEKARSFLNILDRKDILYKILSCDDDDINISIGHENKYDEINDCSIISTTYKIGDYAVGAVGIIGPKRMNYAKVLATMEYFTTCLNKILKDYFDG